MGKNINVNLQFTANTASAKASMAQLQQQLSNLANSVHLGENLNSDIVNAKENILGLKVALQNATNIDTGKLNFSKFNQELKTGKITIGDLARTFSSMGASGQEAFLNLSRQITQSETKVLSLSGQMKKLATTMANTIRWQITASITTGMVSAFSSVIDYAEDLNKSLTEIQYVTGKNIDSMSKFANQAQKAAKSLSSSTLDYADSALLYAQQGLDDQQIKERTAITLKLAQVVNESGSTVSDWMTSIWNNFDDGSHSLEYYADVLTKLGAATASSADEIAGGLEKFSSIADTVGLSYEYAAAAVTTITAKTRQSEDVVGTSLKTIFSRMEDLELGNTLDDGTTLGQYSAALATAGVKVKDVNGNLRDMDDILDDIMDAWGGLTQAQKVSLAQSVSGVRQYSQFMALIDNADAFKENVKYAKESTGELEKEFTYYENSVAGAKARVENDLEAIKNTFLDENSLKPILNIIDGILVYTDKLVKSVGGLPGILASISAIILRIFGPEIVSGARSVLSSISIMSKQMMGKDPIGQQKSAMMIQMSATAESIVGKGKYAENFGKVQGDQFERNQFMANNEASLNSFYKQTLQLSNQLLQAQEEELLKESQKLDLLEEEYEKKKEILGQASVKKGNPLQELQGYIDNGTLNDKFLNKDALGRTYEIFQGKDLNRLRGGAVGSLASNGERTSSIATEIIEKSRTGGNKLSEKELETLKQKITAVKEAEDGYLKSLKETDKKTDVYATQTLKDAKTSLINYMAEINKTNTNLTALKRKYPQLAKEIDAVVEAQKKYKKGSEELSQAEEKLAEAERKVKEEQERALKNSASLGDAFVNALQGAAGLTSGLLTIGSAMSQLTQNILAGENGFSTWLSFASSILSSIPMMVIGLQGVSKAFSSIKAGIDALNTSEEARNNLGLLGIAITKAKEKAEKKAAEVSIKSDERENKSSLKKIGYKLSELIAEGPAGWVIAAVSAAAILALIGGGIAFGISKSNSAKEEKNAEQAQNEYTQKSEIVEENQEKITSFTESYIVYRKTGEGVDDLKASMDELSAAYGENELALASLAEDYEGFIEILKKLENEELEAAITAAQAAKDYNEVDYKEAATSGRGTTNFANAGAEYSISFKNKGSDDDSALYEAINSEDVQKLLDENSDISIGTNNGNIDVDLKTYSAKNLSDMVEILTLIKNTAKENGQTDTKLYGNIVAKLADLSEFYEKDKEYENEILEDELNKAFNNTTVNGKSLEDLDTTSEYAQFYQKIKKQFADNWIDIESLYNSLISAYSNVADYNSYLQAAKAQAEQSGKISEDELFELYSNVDKVTAKALTKVDFSSITNLEDALKEAEKYRAEAQEDIAKGIAQDVGKTSDDAITYAKILKDNNKKLKENAEALQVVTGESIRLNAKLETLTKTYNDNADALLNGKINTTEYAYAVEAVANDLASFLNTDADLSNYVRKNRQTVAEFLNGNYELFDEIQIGVAKFVASSKGHLNELDFAFSAFQGLKAGDIVDDTKTIEAFNKILAAGQLTADQLQAIFEPMGIEFKINGENQVLSAMQTSDSSYLSESLAEEQKKKAKKRKLDFEDELERYHEINEALDDIARELDIVSEAKERAFGNAKLDYLDQEIAKQKESLSLEKQKLSEAQAYYNSDRAALLKYGATLDEDGRISNYDELIKAQVNKVNAASNSDDAYEAAKEAYDKFKDVLDNYEDSLNTMEDQQQAIIEAQYELQDLALEKIQYTVEFKIEGLEDTLKEIEFLMQEVENDVFAAATSIALAGQQANNTLQQIEANSQGIKDIEAALEAGTISTEDGVEQLREYRDELIDLNSELLELRETVQDELTEAFEAWNEKLDDSSSKLEHISTMLESYKSIIDIIGKDSLGISDSVMSQLSATQVSVSIDRITAAKTQRDANKKALEQAQQEYAAALARGDDTSAEEWEEQIKTFEEQVMESEENLLSATEEGLETIQDNFSLTIDQIVARYEDAVSSIYDSLADLQQAFDRTEEINNRYLENYEKVYEINKLNRSIQQSINDTSSLSSKKALASLQEELVAMAQSGVEVSEKDIAYMQKKYDLLLAQKALEDAQNNKTTVRLKRDSNGNFGYVYTADQNSIAEAEQNYEDKLYEMQKYGEESLYEFQSQIIAINQEYEEAITEILNNTNLTEEEKQAKMAETVEYYAGMLEYYFKEADKWLSYGVEMNKLYNADMATDFKNTILGQMSPDLTSFKELYETSFEAMQTTSSEFTTALETYSTQISAALDAAGLSAEDFSKDLQEYLGKAEKASNSLVTAIGKIATEMDSSLTEALKSVTAFQEAYGSQMGTVRTQTQQTIDKVKTLIDKLAELSGEESTSRDLSGNGSTSAENQSPEDVVSEDGDGGSSVYKQSSGEARAETANHDYATSDKEYGTITANNQWHYTLIRDENGISQYEAGSQNIKVLGYLKQLAPNGMRLYKVSFLKGNKSAEGYINQKDLNQLLGNKDITYQVWKFGYNGTYLQAFDTGGYTGDWNTADGKLALLHEKELVLNKNETADFLKMTEQFRNIIANYDYQAAMRRFEFDLSAGTLARDTGLQPVVQDIAISASFPNATNHSEIEEAFKNLSSLATQYVNRKS